MLSLALIILAAPLLGFVLQPAFGRRLPRQGDWMAILGIGASLVCAVIILFKVLGGASLDAADPAAHARWDWMRFGNDVWTVGDNGEILRFNGTAWNTGSSGTTEAFYGIWGVPANDVWAVGNNGNARHSNGTAGAAVLTALRRRAVAGLGP